MAEVNPLIALAGEPLNTAPSAFKLTALRQNDRQFQQRQSLLEKNSAASREVQGLNTQLLRESLADERQKRRLTSSVRAAVPLASLLEAGDVEGAQALLERRRAQIIASSARDPTLDTVETDQALEMLRTDPQRLLQLSKQAVDMGRRFDLIDKDLLSPAELEQKLELKRAGRQQQTIIVGGPGSPGPKRPLTKADIKRDEIAATEIAAFRDLGGMADVQKGLAQLGQAAEALEAGDVNLTGPGLALIPEFALAFANPESISVREAVQEVVQRNLRVILGAQFTQREGEMLMARAFNPRLEEAENAGRVRRLMAAIQLSADQKQAAGDYLDQFGTMQGFEGHTPTVADFRTLSFEKDPEGAEEKTVIINQATGERRIRRAGRWLTIQ